MLATSSLAKRTCSDNAMVVIALALDQLGEEQQARAWYERALASRPHPLDRNTFFGELDYLWDGAAERLGDD